VAVRAVTGLGVTHPRSIGNGRATGSMQLLLPIVRYMAFRSRNRLSDRVMVRRSQGRPVVVLIGRVVPEPVLARLEALYEGMAAVVCVFARVLRGRRITATNVAAARTASKMEPPAVDGEALDTARAARGYRRVDRTFVCHGHPHLQVGVEVLTKRDVAALMPYCAHESQASSGQARWCLS
jgi:hypothetical protein